MDGKQKIITINSLLFLFGASLVFLPFKLISETMIHLGQDFTSYLMLDDPYSSGIVFLGFCLVALILLQLQKIMSAQSFVVSMTLILFLQQLYRSWEKQSVSKAVIMLWLYLAVIFILGLKQRHLVFVWLRSFYLSGLAIYLISGAIFSFLTAYFKIAKSGTLLWVYLPKDIWQLKMDQLFYLPWQIWSCLTFFMGLGFIFLLIRSEKR